MNTAAAVQAVSDFPWGLVSFIGLLVLAGVAWRKGWLGKENEDAIKAQIAKLKGKLNAEEAKLTPTAPARDKATRIAENAALLASGQITQADADAAKMKILAE